jgi:hypothetical protein
MFYKKKNLRPYKQSLSVYPSFMSKYKLKQPKEARRDNNILIEIKSNQTTTQEFWLPSGKTL